MSQGDVFLYAGETNPADVKLRDPTVADGGAGGTFAGAGTVSSFTGAAALKQGEAESAVGTVASFTGAASLRQGEVSTVAGVVSSFTGSALCEQGEREAAVGTVSSFSGVAADRQGELASIAGQVSGFTAAAALQVPVAFAAAGTLALFAGAGVMVAPMPQASAAGKQPRRRFANAYWLPEAPPERAPQWAKVIAIGRVSSFTGAATAATGRAAAASGTVSSFTGSSTLEGAPFLDESELMLLALAA